MFNNRLFRYFSCVTVGVITFTTSGVSLALADTKTLSPQIQIAQTNPEALFEQFSQDMNQAASQMPDFFNGLSQLQSIQNDEQFVSALQQLIPMAAAITTNFNNASQTGQQLAAMMPSGSQEAMLMQQFANVSGEGAQTFGQWIDVLMPMIQATQNQDAGTLENLVNQQLPAVVNRTETFAQSMENIAATVQNAVANQNASDVNNTPQPSTPSTQMDFLEAQRKMQQEHQLYRMMTEMSAAQHRTIMRSLGAEYECTTGYSTYSC